MDQNKKALPAIPNKKYFNIGEVSYLCHVKPHVLRYWEQEFPMLRPSKRKGNRRYYKLKDVEMARTIRQLLYVKGFTIQGAKQSIIESKSETVAAQVEQEISLKQEETSPSIPIIKASTPKSDNQLNITNLINELQEIKAILDGNLVN